MMLKNTLFAAATTLTVIGSSLPAFAFGSVDLGEAANPPQEIPEPSMILGSLVVGGLGLMASKKKGVKSNEEQK